MCFFHKWRPSFYSLRTLGFVHSSVINSFIVSSARTVQKATRRYESNGGWWEKGVNSMAWRTKRWRRWWWSAMVICGSWTDFLEGRNVSCDPNTRYRTRYTLSRLSLTTHSEPEWCPPHDTPHSDGRHRDCLRRRVYKRTHERIFASVAERIALTRTAWPGLSLTKRNTAELLVNNVVFNIVLYGIARYDLYRPPSW